MKSVEVSKIQMAFGARVRELRLAKEMSQEKLGFAAELDRTYIVSVEQGKRNVSLVNIVRIAKALGTTPSAMFVDKAK